MFSLLVCLFVAHENVQTPGPQPHCNPTHPTCKEGRRATKHNNPKGRSERKEKKKEDGTIPQNSPRLRLNVSLRIAASHCSRPILIIVTMTPQHTSRQALSVVSIFHELLMPPHHYFAAPLQQESRKNERERQRESKMNWKKGKEKKHKKQRC